MSGLQQTENPMFPTFHYNENMKRVTFEKPVDGDTAWFVSDDNKEEKVRFLCIDAPEISVLKCDDNGRQIFDEYNEPVRDYLPQDGAIEALDYVTKRLREANEIYLEPDPASDETDKYGRPLYWIWVDGSLLEAELVQHGYARVRFTEVQNKKKEEEDTQTEYKYAKQLKKIEESRNTCPLMSENYLIKIPNANYIRNLEQEDDVAVEVPVITNHGKHSLVTVYTNESMIQKDKYNNLFLTVPITGSTLVQYRGHTDKISISCATLINQSDNYRRKEDERADLCAVPSELRKTEPCVNMSFGRLNYIDQEKGFGYILWTKAEDDSKKKETYFSRVDVKDGNVFNNIKHGDTFIFEQTEDNNGRSRIKNQNINIVPAEKSEVKTELKRNHVKPINTTEQSRQDTDTDARELYKISGIALMKDSPNASSVMSGTILIDSQDIKESDSSEKTDIITIHSNHNYYVQYADDEEYTKISGDQLIKEWTDGANMLQYQDDQFLATCTDEEKDIYQNSAFDREQRTTIKQMILFNRQSNLSIKMPTEYIKTFANPDLQADSMKDDFNEAYKGLLHGLSNEQIQIYAKSCYDASQMAEIRQGLEHGKQWGIDDEKLVKQVEVYAKPEYDSFKMHQIRIGFENGLSAKQISAYAYDDIEAGRMAIIRTGLEKGLSVEQAEFLADRNLNDNQAEAIEHAFIEGLSIDEVIPFVRPEFSSGDMTRQFNKMINGKHSRSNRPLPQGYEDVKQNETDERCNQTDTKNNKARIPESFETLVKKSQLYQENIIPTLGEGFLNITSEEADSDDQYV